MVQPYSPLTQETQEGLQVQVLFRQQSKLKTRLENLVRTYNQTNSLGRWWHSAFLMFGGFISVLNSANKQKHTINEQQWHEKDKTTFGFIWFHHFDVLSHSLWLIFVINHKIPFFTHVYCIILELDHWDPAA